MSERWVVIASPLIVLCRVGLQGVFFDLTEQVVVPQAVVEEINAGPSDDPARHFLLEGKISVVEAPQAPAELIAWDLGAGESSVIAYAISNPDWVAILDDAAARKCARSLSIPHRGTLGIVLLAKRQGLIASAANVLRSLKSAGFHLDEHVIREALQQTVGEDW